MSVKSVRALSSLYWLVGIIYFFTGLSALAYEVLWARILSTIFGVSIFGVVVTISAFLAGLGLGSIAGKKYLNKIINPLRVFALLEVTVAIFAFNLPILLSQLDGLLSLAAVENYSSWLTLQTIATFVLMFIPAFILGIGFPMILATVQRGSINVGTVYALNTLGGVIGALLPLFLLPFAGWNVSIRLVAIFALLMGVGAFILSFFLPAVINTYKDTNSEKKHSPPMKLLLTYALIGAAAIMLEIAWTRLYGMILLRTEYVMAVILATFLAGIGIGSLLAAKVRDVRWLIMLPVLVAISALISLYSLPIISEWAENVEYESLFEAMLMQGGLVALITLPATLAFGAWFPVLVSLFKNAEYSGSLLYGFNSIGAAIGGLVAGFTVLPIFGTAPLIFISLILVLMVSFYWIKATYYKVIALVLIVSAVPVIQIPGIEKLLPLSQSESHNLFFYEDAMSLTHVIEKKNGERLLLADLQRMDASSDPTAVRVQKNQSRLPVMLHPNPEKVLFLGLGTGITAAGTLPFKYMQRTSIELSKGAIQASEQYFSEVNGRISKSTQIIRDDARRFLKSSNEQFDVIVGDLFHPDLIGRSELLSIQQFERAKSKLNADGIFVQWLALNQFDLPTLKVVLATFQAVFPDAILFVDGFRLAMVGVNGTFYGIKSLKDNLAKLDSASIVALTGGEGLWSWASRYWGPIQNVSGSKLQDEWAPVIEFQLPRAKFNRQNHLQHLLKFLMVNRQSVDEAKKEMKLDGNDETYFEQVHTANQMYYQSWLAYFAGEQLEAQKLLTMAYSYNPDDQWIGFGIADAMFSSLDTATEQGIDKKEALQKILTIRPDHLAALKALRDEYVGEENQAEVNVITNKISALSPFEHL